MPTVSDPWYADAVTDLVGVFVGWLLGFATTWLTDKRRDRKRVEDSTKAIKGELREVAHRMMMVVYRGELARGQLTRDILEWMAPQIEEYAGPNPKEGLLTGVKGLLQRSQQELDKYNIEGKISALPQTWQPEQAPYATAAMAQAHDFAPQFAAGVLDVLSHIKMFNEMREATVYFTRLTFAPGLTEDNGQRAVRNIEYAEDNLIKRARIIVDKIGRIEG